MCLVVVAHHSHMPLPHHAAHPTRASEVLRPFLSESHPSRQDAHRVVPVPCAAAQGTISPIGWTIPVMVEAQVVNILDAAAAGNKGLLHPLLLRHQARGCPATVFALPAVQVRHKDTVCCCVECCIGWPNVQQTLSAVKPQGLSVMSRVCRVLSTRQDQLEREAVMRAAASFDLSSRPTHSSCVRALIARSSSLQLQ